jgi:tRNA(Ile2) C34 agmatinyltransferase TiaS
MAELARPKPKKRRRGTELERAASKLARAAGVVAGFATFLDTFVDAFKPKLAPGETEVLPELRTCPTCGWRASAECRLDIECPTCGTRIPYAGGTVVSSAP